MKMQIGPYRCFGLTHLSFMMQIVLGGLMFPAAILALTAAAMPHPKSGMVMQARGAGALTCAAAFQLQSRVATENWIAGFWSASDLVLITKADPIARSASLGQIVAEVEKLCSDEPGAGLLSVILKARELARLREASEPR
jgi:hypothetical protein